MEKKQRKNEKPSPILKVIIKIGHEETGNKH